jgi:hypothetical protein
MQVQGKISEQAEQVPGAQMQFHVKVNQTVDYEIGKRGQHTIQANRGRSWTASIFCPNGESARIGFGLSTGCFCLWRDIGCTSAPLADETIISVFEAIEQDQTAPKRFSSTKWSGVTRPLTRLSPNL